MITHCIDCGHEGCSPGCSDLPHARGTCPDCGCSTRNGRCADPQGCGYGWTPTGPRNLYPVYGD